MQHAWRGRNVYNILVKQYKGKKHSGRPRDRVEGNIKMDLTEIG
jgi:hypothetical protein